jgi:hypothetical protein
MSSRRQLPKLLKSPSLRYGKWRKPQRLHLFRHKEPSQHPLHHLHHLHRPHRLLLPLQRKLLQCHHLLQSRHLLQQPKTKTNKLLLPLPLSKRPLLPPPAQCPLKLSLKPMHKYSSRNKESVLRKSRHQINSQTQSPNLRISSNPHRYLISLLLGVF